MRCEKVYSYLRNYNLSRHFSLRFPVFQVSPVKSHKDSTNDRYTKCSITPLQSEKPVTKLQQPRNKPMASRASLLRESFTRIKESLPKRQLGKYSCPSFPPCADRYSNWPTIFEPQMSVSTKQWVFFATLMKFDFGLQNSLG